VISVFQHYRRVPFDRDFARIRERLLSDYATAIYWHPHIMFVAISSRRETIEKVKAANILYSQGYPVRALC
jgi:hypothetical protein